MTSAYNERTADEAATKIADMTVDMLLYFQSHSDVVSIKTLIDAFSDSLQDGHDMAIIMLTMITKAVEESQVTKQ